MKIENKISFTVSAEEKTKIEGAINDLREVLLPKLISLTPQQRQEIAKMRDKSLPFVEKALDYAKTRPEFAPRFVDVADFEIDLKAVRELAGYYRPLFRIVEQLNHTIMQSGNEAYVASLSVYGSAQEGAKRNVSGAEQVYNDLKQRFAKASKPEDDADDLKDLKE